MSNSTEHIFIGVHSAFLSNARGYFLFIVQNVGATLLSITVFHYKEGR